ncbi:hypothetical protein PV325_002497 [Microctonus aethiopoides]|nr:hypothetical protein PV325_002497 [Microctonus aethiopoides]
MELQRRNMEAVNRFKYLGYWFFSGNSDRVQCEDIAGKAQEWKVFENMWNGETVGKIRGIIEIGMLKLRRDCLESEKEKIEKSTYSAWYKEIVPEGKGMKY